MKIDGYIMSMADDVDVLPDALDSLAKFCDRIFVVDGMMGRGTLSHHPRYMQSIREWLFHKSHDGTDERVGKYQPYEDMMGSSHYFSWNEVPAILYENEFLDPAHQRNFILGEMAKELEQPDWIAWIDSDEVCSNEFINGVRPYLASLPSDVVGICPKWLTLSPDEKHCVRHMSDWLAHPRIHKPNSAYFQGSWHEHMVIDRSKCRQWDVRVIHTRALFMNRLKVQRGHDGVATGQTPLWADAVIVDIPEGVTWATLHYPEGEVRPNSDNL